MRHFDAHVLYQHRTGRGVPNAPVTITDTATGQTVDTFDADEQPLTLVSNERGWVPPFRADALLVRSSAPGATTRPLIAYEAVIITPLRQALLDAIAAYSDLPVQWSDDEPTDTDALWVHPVTGVARVWSAGVDGSAEDVVTRRNLVTNPRGRNLVNWYAAGSTSLDLVQGIDPLGNTDTLARWTGPASTSGPYYRAAVGDVDGQEGQWLALSVWVRPIGQDVRMRADPQPRLGSSGPTRSGTYEWYEADQWHQIAEPVQATSDFDNYQYWLRPIEGAVSEDVAVDITFMHAAIADTEEAALAAVSTYFDGDTPERRTDNIIYRYAWDDTPHASPSTETALGQGWHEIIDPDVVAAGQAYAEAVDGRG